MDQESNIINTYKEFINQKEFPCVAAKAALSRTQVECFVANNICCPADDPSILTFLYSFVNRYRKSAELYHSAAIIFRGPLDISEEMFDQFLWQRLQSISGLDALKYEYDPRVNNDPMSKEFSFSIMGEAFFIIGLHPGSSRPTRQFNYPTLVFNPHAQFEKLRETSKYAHLKNVVRKRDLAFSGSVNPMLDDFGNASEVFQYSGKVYDKNWECPLKIKHGNNNNTAA